MHNYNDLQATQYIISLFEKSSSQSDDALESLPGIYAVIDSKGEILKGNKILAALLNVELENLLSTRFFQLLTPESRVQLEKAIGHLTDSKIPRIEIKIDVFEKNHGIRNYLLDVRQFQVARSDVPKLFSIVGRDVTDLTQTTELKTRMQMELVTAKLVQDRLFPLATATFGNTTIAGHYSPATECGGDWWHYGLMNDKLFIWIGDVTGHGVPSALVVSAVNAVVTTLSGKSTTPAEAMGLLNKIVYATAKSQLAMTFFIASIDLKTRACTYCSAAHEPMILLPQSQKSFTAKSFQFLEADPSSPLGLKNDQSFKEQTVTLSAGDRLVLYTDGIREITSPSGSKWNNLNFYRALAPLAGQYRDSESLVYALEREIEKFREGTALVDDVTFAVLSLEA